ncbi:MAG: ABC transporter substrate-binding protein [Chloroflexi bacterium]|nr:ABC transporter substrate-binding protein [Chloroflexota bacterium]
MRRFVILGLMVIAALSAGACTRQEAAPAMAFGDLKISVATIGLVGSPLYVAEAKGFFREQGFASVEITAAGGGTPSQNAVQGGQAHFGAQNAFAGVVDATAAGRPEIAIFTNARQQSEDLIMRKDVADRLGITEKSPLDQRMKALKGLTIAVSSRGSGTDEMARYVLKTAGLDPEKDANIVTLGSEENRVAGLVGKSVDVAAVGLPQNEMVILKGDGIRLVGTTLGEFEPIRGMLYNIAFGMKDFIEGNPEFTQAFVNALVKGAKFVMDNPNEAKQIVRSSRFPEIDEKVFDAAWEVARQYSANPEVTLEGAEKAYRLKKVVWDEEAKFPAGQVINNDFVKKAKEQLGWR